jgi:hypothetical protein
MIKRITGMVMMNDNVTFIQTIVITIVTGLLATIPGFLAYVAGKRREHAEARRTDASYADAISETAMKLVKPLEARIAAMEKDIEYLASMVRAYERYVSYLLDGITKLMHQLNDAKISPEWEPIEFKAPTKPGGVHDGKEAA